jgi:hypothetical protein
VYWLLSRATSPSPFLVPVNFHVCRFVRPVRNRKSRDTRSVRRARRAVRRVNEGDRVLPHSFQRYDPGIVKRHEAALLPLSVVATFLFLFSFLLPSIDNHPRLHHNYCLSQPAEKERLCAGLISIGNNESPTLHS